MPGKGLLGQAKPELQPSNAAGTSLTCQPCSAGAAAVGVAAGHGACCAFDALAAAEAPDTSLVMQTIRDAVLTCSRCASLSAALSTVGPLLPSVCHEV